MSVNFPLTRGIWGHVQSGLPTAVEAKSFSCLETGAMRGLVALAGAVAVVVTPVFFLLDLFYLAVKAMGCVKEENDGETITLDQKDITDQTNEDSPIDDVFQDTFATDPTDDKKPLVDKKPSEVVDKTKGNILKRTPLPIASTDALLAAQERAVAIDRERPDGRQFEVMRKQEKGVGVAGVENLKKKVQEQVATFKEWADKGDWENFSHSYSLNERWIIPNGREDSKAIQLSGAVDDIARLKRDPRSMDRFRTAVKLAVLSCGFDLESNRPVENRNVHWDFWDMRLGKIARCLRLFGEQDLLDRLQNYVKSSMNQANLEEIEQLKKDPEFMDNLRNAVKLVVLSWGWDLEKNSAVENRKVNQNWDFCDERLGKMANCLRLFGEWELLARLQNYVKSDFDRLNMPQPWVLDQLLLNDWFVNERMGGLD